MYDLQGPKQALTSLCHQSATSLPPLISESLLNAATRELRQACCNLQSPEPSAQGAAYHTALLNCLHALLVKVKHCAPNSIQNIVSCIYDQSPAGAQQHNSGCTCPYGLPAALLAVRHS